MKVEKTNWYRCIHECFEAQVVATPEAVAVVCEQQSFTYYELNQRANCLAHYLRRLGVGAEVLVGLYLERSLDLIVAILAVLKAGGAYVPLDPSYPPERIRFMLEDAQMPVLLAQKHQASDLPASSARIIYLDADWADISQESILNPVSVTAPEHLAYVIYTSGSTGNPKGVMIEHRSLVNFVFAAQQAYGIQPTDRVLQFASISFDTAIEEIFPTLTIGATLVLRTPEMLHSIPAFFRACQQFQLTVLALSTAFWHRICAELPTTQLPSTIRLLMVGGERLLPRWLDIWKQQVSPEVRLINGYGPTESTVVATCCDLAGHHAIAIIDDRIPIGQPLINIQTYVLDADMQPVRPGTVGELYISGKGLARGYLNRPDLTAQTFVYCAIDGKTLRLYKTGDLVCCRTDGHLEFLDRIDHQTKIRGFRVELREIETVLARHAAVNEAVITTREDTLGDKRLTAYVVPNAQELEAISAPDRERLETSRVEQWKQVNDSDPFNSTQASWDETFNISGWLSSYTGALIPDEEMHEWVDQTVARILQLQPQQVLEIGCGTGLLLFQIAPHCASYRGVDISEAALRYVQQQLTHSNQTLPVVLEERVADDFTGIAPHSVDTVILNSVIQYFPSIDYLITVIERAVQTIKPGGSLFIGDVRNYRLLEAFATAVEVYQAADDLPTEHLWQRIQRRIRHEEELTIDPAFFTALQRRIPHITQVQVLLKRGKHQNELTQFRYDVILHIGSEPCPAVECPWLSWQEQPLTIPKLRQRLQETHPPILGIHGIPNQRVLASVTAVQQCHPTQRRLSTAGELWQGIAHDNSLGVDPEAFWQLSQELPYDVTLHWTGLEPDGSYTVLLRSTLDPQPGVLLPQPQPKPWHAYANNPLQAQRDHDLVIRLRAYLQQHLPDYMIPSAFVVLDALPLTPNGKVDRRALPVPGSTRPALTAFCAPQTGLEQQLADLWSSVLEINDIGIHDSFFELGGDSLRLMQLLSQIEATHQITVSVIDFFRLPTIAGLVQQMQSHTPSTQSPLSLDFTPVDDILPSTTPSANPDRWTDPQTIFLTGATGFLGAFILAELLRQTQAKVYCLIRAQTLTQAYQRLRHTFAQYLPGVQIPYARIHPVMGDLAQPLLGLSKEQFQRLADQVDVIYHSAANVNLLYPYAALKAANVLGTQSVLQLAGHSKLKPVHFISTLDVFESLASTNVEVIYEHDRVTQQHELTSGYAQSKWISEHLVHLAASRGIPTCIYRPGMVTGHCQSGASNPEDLICRMLKSFTQLQCAPNLELTIDMTPVDYVSRAIIHLSLQSASIGKAFHLINPQPTRFDHLIQYMNEYGYAVQAVDYHQWQTALHTRWNALSPLAKVLTESVAGYPTRLELWLGGTQKFDYQNTMHGLKESDITCAPIDSRLLGNYLTHLIQRGALSSPHRLTA